jgi:hypothetical protein
MSRGVVALVGILVFAGTAMAATPVVEPPAAVHAEPAGMEPLFNGRDLAGWDGDPRLWSVKDGVIHGETTAAEPAVGNTFLIRQGAPVRNFELRLSFRCTADNNSGIQYRSTHVTDPSARNRWVVKGYQHEIRNERDFPNVPGFIYDEGGLAGGRGRICQVGEKAAWPAEGDKQVTATLIDADDFRSLMKVGDWNDVVIRAEGNHLRHWLNGRLILDFTDNHPKALSEGVVALQLHAGKPMWAEFRDIRLKRLD